MTTITYLIFWILAGAGAVGLGLLTHYWHAEFQPFPDELFDGKRPIDTVLNELLSPQYSLLGAYDDYGYWKFYSWKNFALHTVPLLVIVVVAGFAYWPDRADVVALICGGLQQIGLEPLTC